jgi:uncharacterized protein (DUF2147 family)
LQSFAAVTAIFLAASPQALAGKELGTWLNTDRAGKIHLRECGEQELCGEIVWLKDAVDENGEPWRDRLNPDLSLRGRKVVGIDVLVGTKKIGPMTWQGQIYDPEVGKLYYLKHLKVGRDKVEIKGCLSSGWPCRTKYWTRARPVAPPAPPVQVAKQKAVPEPSPKPAPPVRTATRNTAPKPGPVIAPPVRVTRQNTANKPKPKSEPPFASPVTVEPPAPPPAQAQVPYPQNPPQPALRPTLTPPEVTASLPSTTGNRGTGYMVQVAARQSHNEALQAFRELQLRFPQVLGGLLPEIVRADLGQRGIWYRVGVGGLAQQSAAVDFCQRLKSVGADCLIRRR